jgi:hypothetical protein
MNHASSRVAASFAALMVTFVLSACGEIEPSEEPDTPSRSETSQDETPAPRPHSQYSGGSKTPVTNEIGTHDPNLGKSDLGPASEEEDRFKRPPE